MSEFSSKEITARLRALGNAAQVFPIGFSAEGTPMLCARFGSGSRRVFISAAHHGNEWITALLLLRFAEEYAAARDGARLGGTDASTLRGAATAYLLPLVDPDGADIASGAAEGSFPYGNAKRIASRFPDIPFPRGWKANAKGIDLNLQYPAAWEETRKRKFALGYDKPAPRDYAGNRPVSQPESRALYRFTRRGGFDAVLALHTQGEVIYDRFRGYAPPGSDALAAKLSAASGYPLEATPAESDGGGFKDWFIAEFDRPGFTVECGSGENPLPLSDADGIYRRLLPLLTAFILG